jgi:hypothetical protein
LFLQVADFNTDSQYCPTVDFERHEQQLRGELFACNSIREQSQEFAMCIKVMMFFLWWE